MSNVMSNGIPLPEFAKMLYEARTAFEASDMATAGEINERFSQWGYGLIVDSGTLRLDNLTLPKPMKEATVGLTRADYIRR